MEAKAQAIIDEFNENMNKEDGVVINAGMQGAIIGTLEKSCVGKENRKRVLRMLTGHTSSKELNGAHWNALYLLVLPYKPEGGKWGTGNPNLDEACQVLLNADVDQPGQTKMFEYPEFEGLIELEAEGFVKKEHTEIQNGVEVRVIDEMKITSANWVKHVENQKVQDSDDIPF